MLEKDGDDCAGHCIGLTHFRMIPHDFFGMTRLRCRRSAQIRLQKLGECSPFTLSEDPGYLFITTNALKSFVRVGGVLPPVAQCS
jgi:hypothetical protein